MAFRDKSLTENFKRITNPQSITEADHPELDKFFDDATREKLDAEMHKIANATIDMINKAASKYEHGKKNKEVGKWILAYLVDELDDRKTLHKDIKDNVL